MNRTRGPGAPRGDPPIERTWIVLTLVLACLVLVAAIALIQLARTVRRLARRLENGARQQHAFKEVARELGASIRVDEVVESIARHAVASTHAFGAYVERADRPEPGSEVEVVAVAGSGVPRLGTRVPYPGSLSEEIIEAGEPQLLTEIGAIGERMAPYLRASCHRCSGLVVSLSSEEKILGALVLLRDLSEPHFTPEERAYAGALGDLASAALRRVLLLEAVQESESRFQQIADHLQEVIWLGAPDLSARYYVNPAYEKVWGRSRASFYEHPRSPVEAVHPDDLERVEAALAHLPRGEYDVEYRIIRPDGQVRWIWSRGYPIRNERGKVRRIAGIMEDITETKRAERAARESARERERLLQGEREARAEADRERQELERVTESRIRLMRGFSHDVKNPLGAADGYAALLEEGVYGELTGPQRESIERIRRSLKTGLHLVSDLLELAQAEAGQLPIEHEATDLALAIEEVADEFRAQAKAAGLALDVDLTGADLVTESDPARVRQILGNLLSNAVRYTPAGGVMIRAGSRMEGGPHPGEWITIRVSDTGPGIPEEMRAQIFQEFSRLDSRLPQGAGIGLAISLRIARLLGGDLTLESEIGRGSDFILWLPYTSRHGQRPAPSAHEQAEL